jgi:hypothetical protein
MYKKECRKCKSMSVGGVCITRKGDQSDLRNLAIAKNKNKKSVSFVPIASHNPHSRFAGVVGVVVVGDLVLHHNSNNDTDNR